MQLFAPQFDLLFQLVQERFIVKADCLHQAGNQQVAGRFGCRQEIRHEIARALALPLRTVQGRRVDEGAIEFAPLEQTLFEQPVESGHHGGVCQGAVQAIDHISHIAFAVRPHDLHYGDFQRTEGLGCGQMVFEKSHRIRDWMDFIALAGA